MVYDSVHIDDEGFLLSDLRALFVRGADMLMEVWGEKKWL